MLCLNVVAPTVHVGCCCCMLTEAQSVPSAPVRRSESERQPEKNKERKLKSYHSVG